MKNKFGAIAMAHALAAMGDIMAYDNGMSRGTWRFERNEKPRKPKYSLEPIQPKGTKIHESDYKGIEIKFYYGTEKARQKKIIKIHHEIDNYLNSLNHAQNKNNRV